MTYARSECRVDALRHFVGGEALHDHARSVSGSAPDRENGSAAAGISRYLDEILA